MAALALEIQSVRFYDRLQKQDQKWKNLLKQAERPLESLDEQADQYRHVKSLKLKEVQETIGEEAWERLQHKIHMSLEKEVTLLLDILVQLKNISQDIKNYWENLQDARCNVFVNDESMKELLEGMWFRPNLDNLLIWAIFAHRHYDKMCLRISNCFDKLNYNVSDTVEDLVAVFVEDSSERKHMNTILTLTEFMVKERSFLMNPTMEGQRLA